MFSETFKQGMEKIEKVTTEWVQSRDAFHWQEKGGGGWGKGIREGRPSSAALGNINHTVFPVVVVQRDAKRNVPKKFDTRAELLF